MELKVGQKVFVKTIGNAARRGSEIREEIISKVGNKYFYLEDFRHEKFCKERLRDISEYISNYAVYESRQAILDEEEAARLVRSIKDCNFSDMSLDNLRTIQKIIDAGNTR